jgi:hypothetical protein
VSLVTLGVRDVEAAAAFYERLGWTRSNASVPGDVAFFATTTGTAVALWGDADLAADAARTRPAGPAGAADPAAFRGVSLAMNLGSPAEVDAVLDAARAAGATVTKPAVATEWGGYSGYFADPDGHAWEVAHNPHWPLDAEGRVTLP